MKVCLVLCHGGIHKGADKRNCLFLEGEELGDVMFADTLVCAEAFVRCVGRYGCNSNGFIGGAICESDVFNRLHWAYSWCAIHGKDKVDRLHEAFLEVEGAATGSNHIVPQLCIGFRPS